MKIEQPSLFDAQEREASIQAKFEKFHADHPEVYDELLGLARQMYAAGRKKIGIGMLWEVLRWHRTLRGVEDDTGYKLNNNYRSRYVRLMIEREPEFDGFFELRRLSS